MMKKKLSITRRSLLGGMLAAPVVSLTSCGGSSAQLEPAGEATSQPGSGAPAQSALQGPADNALPAALPAGDAGQTKPPFVFFEYGGYVEAPTAVQDQLPLVPTQVTTTADRFAEGALCYEFSGMDSNIVVAPFTGFPVDDFALLLWVRSSSQSQMELLRIGGSDHRAFVLEVNGSGALTVYVTNVIPFVVPREAAAPLLTDGNWHHVAVQRFGTQLQIFFDGVQRHSFQLAVTLPSHAAVTIGESWQGAIDGVRLYDRAFSPASIAQSVYQWNPVKASTQSATGSLAAYYPFNGNAQNYLGYGVEGVPNAVVPTADRSGVAGAAYLFNGSNAYVALDQPFSSTTGPFAIAFWEQSTAAGPMTALSATSGGPAVASLDVVFNGAAALQVYINGAAMSGMSAGASGALTDGNWHFVVLQATGSALELFVDGALVASAPSGGLGFFGGNSVMQFGRGSGASPAVANYWNGALDDVQIYEVALTPDQVLALQGLDFLPRDGAGPLVFEDKLWLLGGWNPAIVPVTNNEVWCSQDGTNWSMVAQAPWQRRHDAGYAVLNGRMWIVGGDRLTGNYQNDVWSSADGVNWEQATDTVPWANRATQYVLTFNNRLWLMGGQQILESSAPPVVAYNDVWSSADGANWELATPNAAWSPRGIIMGNVVYQGKMWVIGGGQYDVRTFNNDVWSSPDGVNWTLVQASAPWTARQFHNITVFDNKIWVLAGGDAASQGGLNDVWYSSDGALWTQLANAPWIARHAASTFVWNNYLWLTCGSNDGGDNDVWKLGYAL